LEKYCQVLEKYCYLLEKHCQVGKTLPTSGKILPSFGKILPSSLWRLALANKQNFYLWLGLKLRYLKGFHGSLLKLTGVEIPSLTLLDIGAL
jgi:hypothetical protein